MLFEWEFTSAFPIEFDYTTIKLRVAYLNIVTNVKRVSL